MTLPAASPPVVVKAVRTDQKPARVLRVDAVTGDVLLTGTPDGVGPIVPGDRMEAEVVGVAKVRNPVVAG